MKESLTLDKAQVPYYAYRNIVYVAHPKNADYEKLNLFVPAAYLEGKTVNGYTAKTAQQWGRLYARPGRGPF